MRILMFGWEFPPHISGGLGTACYELTRTLSRHGNAITFVVPRADKPARKSHVHLVAAAGVPLPYPSSVDEFFQSLNLKTADSILRPYLTEEEYPLALLAATGGGADESSQQSGKQAGHPSVMTSTSHYGKNLMAEVARYSEIGEELALKEEFDIIHAHDWMTFLAAIRAKRATGKPMVAHIHALEYDRSGDSINGGIFEIEKMGMEAADHVIAVSHYTRNLIISHYGIRPEKISVVHNAVSRHHATRVYHVPHDRKKKTVLFLGRITSQKGPDYFIEAAARVLEKTPDVMFVMAGAGDMLPRMIERVGELRLGMHFHFTGFLQGHDVERMYAMSDLYVMPSVSEPFGLSPLEAMIYDVPVILSKQAGVNEIMPHALIVDFWNVDDIANKILAILKYPALSRELLRNGRKALRSIRWEVAAERIQLIYNKLAV
ncbi:MAG: glycosyltransferase family 4 protein [bacterium]